MGKPGWGNAQSRWSEYIRPVEGTGGIETSEYPEERKAIATSLVAASEQESAQTVAVEYPYGVAVVGLWEALDRA